MHPTTVEKTVPVLCECGRWSKKRTAFIAANLPRSIAYVSCLGCHAIPGRLTLRLTPEGLHVYVKRKDIFRLV